MPETVNRGAAGKPKTFRARDVQLMLGGQVIRGFAPGEQIRYLRPSAAERAKTWLEAHPRSAVALELLAGAAVLGATLAAVFWSALR